MLTVFRGFTSSITPFVEADRGQRLRLEKITGCDGRHHVTWPIKVFCDPSSEEVRFAESQPLQNVELCDGSCLERPTVAEFVAEAY